MQILYGSASSGKSVFIAQRDDIDIINEPRNFLVVRNTANTLRDSVFAERVKFIRALGLAPVFNIRESDMSIEYVPRGNRMFFRGLDDTEKLKSITFPVGVLTDLRIEEATELSEADFDNLKIRMRGLSPVIKRTVLSFNPIFRSHWICKRFFNGQLIKYRRDENVLLFHTTYRNNRFLTDQDRHDLESYTGYMRDVYCDGKWGVLGDLIFNNWSVADLTGMEFPDALNGLDFGFSSGVSALCRCAVKQNEKTIFILAETYDHGMTNDMLAARIKPFVNDETVWCDSAEPKSITEIRNDPINRINAQPVKKGKDSVYHAIQWLQQWKIVVGKNCPNMVNELSQYQWQKNKDGQTLPHPVEHDDHLIAALRYGTEIYRNYDRPTISV